MSIEEGAKKPAKGRKSRADPKEKKPKAAKTASHPPYFEMIKEALVALNEKGGSSPYAIAKYMEGKHRAVLPENFRKILGLQLKNSAAKGKLIKIKASYKLSESGKKDKASEKKTTPGATKPRAAAPAAAGGSKRKKSTRAKAKQPKSIKSPNAKRGKKVAAA